MKNILSVILLIILLIGCSPAKKTGEAITAPEQQTQAQANTTVLKPLEPIDTADDPKKEEALGIVREFVHSIKFPDVSGYPSTVDDASFQLVGFVIDENMYTTITRFRLRTMKGPLNKQYTIVLKSKGDGYEIVSVREDK